MAYGDGRPPGRYTPQFPSYETRAALDPPTTRQRAQDPNIQWVRESVYYPTPFRPIDPNIGEQFRRYQVDAVINVAANTETPRDIQISIPATLFALTGAAVDTTGAALPAGLDPLDTFLVQFQHSTGDLIDTRAALGSALLGTAQFPGLIGGPGWHFDRGSSLLVSVTPLRADLRIDISCWMIEYRGPSNYNPLG